MEIIGIPFCWESIYSKMLKGFFFGKNLFISKAQWQKKSSQRESKMESESQRDLPSACCFTCCCPPCWCLGQEWIQVKLKIGSSNPGLHVGVRNPVAWAINCCFPGYAESWAWEQSWSLSLGILPRDPGIPSCVLIARSNTWSSAQHLNKYGPNKFSKNGFSPF